MRNHDTQGVKWEDNPNLARWFNAIDERPAVKAALAKVGAIKSTRETASDDDKDRFFGRVARPGSVASCIFGGHMEVRHAEVGLRARGAAGGDRRDVRRAQSVAEFLPRVSKSE